MNKTRLFFACALIAALTCILLAGCSKEEKIASVNFKDHDPNVAIEMTMGAFDCSAYTLVVNYESGRTEELPLTEEMIAETDLFKFYRDGEHDITVSYGKYKYIFKIFVKRSEFGALSFSANNVFTYDGSAHTVEVEGDMPANAVVTYPSGNSFVNAGTYDVTAIVSCDGYITAKLFTTVKIERAKYDMSSVKFEPKEFVYDGLTHTVKITGTLPEGVSTPKYTINGASATGVSDAGTYTVTASFSSKNPNYEAIPDMHTTMTILPAEYNLSGLSLVFKSENGEVLGGLQKIYDGTSVLFELGDRTKLPNKVSVAYSVYDEQGTLISASNTATKIVNAGVYTVKAEFILADSKNYKQIEPIVYTFEVKKAQYDQSKIHFDSNLVTYDGKAHKLAVEISPELDVGIENVTYEYYLNGELVASGADASVTNIGEYTVKAIFTVTDENYEAIGAMEATLKIESAGTFEPFDPSVPSEPTEPVEPTDPLE